MSYLFSVLIPVYNTGRGVEKCLDSLNDQTFKDFEIVIVNDGSTDDTDTVINEYITAHPELNFSYFCQKNQGAGAARNFALSKAAGDYIVFIDADDYWDPDYLNDAKNLIDVEKSDVVFVDIVREKENGDVIRYERMSKYSNLSKDRMIRSQLTGKIPWGGVRKIVRKSIVRDNNLCYAPIKVGEESIYSFGVLANANTISFQKTSLYHYVDSEGSLTSHDTVDNSRIVHDFIYDYFETTGQKDKYITTLRALSVTTVGIALNLINQTYPQSEKKQAASAILARYEDKIKGKVDLKALDSRILLLYPFIRLGFVSPVFWASRIQSIVNSKNK